jgi:tetratricopeptide (TPR) repeat protein
MSVSPPGDPSGVPRIEMHGEAHEYSTFTQIGTQIVQPLPPSELEVRYSLPPDAAAFTGRDEEMRLITAPVTDAATVGTVVAIQAIGGMPGVGKTALAVHIAHLLQNQFPDRQLFIDLHAHTPGHEPVLPEAALAGLLMAVGVDARYLPGDLEGRTALWRNQMAGQRALLVLDNAATSSQVAPLLPGAEGCLVLVTSRRHLGDLPGPVVPVLLDALTPTDAQAMFLRLAPRSAATPAGEIQELVQLAGYLPLAISLLARVYARHPSWTLADLTAETKNSMLTLAAEKDSVFAAFEVSYRYLAVAQQKFLCQLGLHPGTTIDAYAACALAGIPLRDAAEHLDTLQGEGLLTESAYGRYRMHDLIRRYVSERTAIASEADQDTAMRRLLDYYQHTAAIAENRLGSQWETWAIAASPSSAPPAVPDLMDAKRALSWYRTERSNLLACLDYTTRNSQHARVMILTAAVATMLQHDGPWGEAVTRHACAVQAARHLDDEPGQANALSNLGVSRWLSGDYQAAVEDLQAALSIYRDLGDEQGEANTLANLGMVRRHTGDYRAATGELDAALVMFSRLRDRLGQAKVLTALGVVNWLTGDYRTATENLEATLVICRDRDDRLGQANALANLGIVRQLSGDFRAAAQAQEEAFSIHRDLDNPRGQASAHTQLGIVRRRTGDYRGAAEEFEAALAMFRDLGSRLGQANALANLGIVWRLTGDYEAATRDLESALSIHTDLNNKMGQANTISELAIVRQMTGDCDLAAEANEAALIIYRDIGDRGGQAAVLNKMGTLQRARDDLERAGEYHQQALYLSREIGSQWDEANALAGLGRCALAAGRTTQGEDSLRQAQDIFRKIGAAETDD